MPDPFFSDEDALPDFPAFPDEEAFPAFPDFPDWVLAVWLSFFRNCSALDSSMTTALESWPL